MVSKGALAGFHSRSFEGVRARGLCYEDGLGYYSVIPRLDRGIQQALRTFPATLDPAVEPRDDDFGVAG